MVDRKIISGYVLAMRHRSISLSDAHWAFLESQAKDHQCSLSEEVRAIVRDLMKRSPKVRPVGKSYITEANLPDFGK